MPAEKLTKYKLAQVIVMMILLTGLFFYRTFNTKITTTVQCSSEAICHIDVNGNNVNVEPLQNNLSNGEMNMVLKPIHQTWKLVISNRTYAPRSGQITTPIKIPSSATLILSGTHVIVIKFTK
jgi:hypothetical protein